MGLAACSLLQNLEHICIANILPPESFQTFILAQAYDLKIPLKVDLYTTH